MPAWKWGPDNANLKIAVPVTTLVVRGSANPGLNMFCDTGLVSASATIMTMVIFSEDIVMLNPITTVHCKLSGVGLPEIQIPISSFNVYRYQSGKRYIQVVVPDFDLADEIANRSNGLLVVNMKRQGENGIRIYDEIARAPISQIRLDEGARHKSITLHASLNG